MKQNMEKGDAQLCRVLARCLRKGGCLFKFRSHRLITFEVYGAIQRVWWNELQQLPVFLNGCPIDLPTDELLEELNNKWNYREVEATEEAMKVLKETYINMFAKFLDEK